jgi:hypothetical protein
VDESTEKNYYQNLKRLTDYELEEIAFDIDKTTEKDRINDYFRELINPKNFKGMDSVERVYELQFEETCHYLSKHTNKDPKKLTVKEFYSLLKFIDKQGKNDV